MSANKFAKKQTLFDDEDVKPKKHSKKEEVDEDALQINTEFAKRFEHNKRRELLDKAKA